MLPETPLTTLLPTPVLIVEDEPLFMERLIALLCRQGYSADSLECSSNLDQARRRIAVQPPALALVDIGLPDGSGIDLIAELRAADAEMGILVISAWSTKETILNALRSGASGYVLKEREDLEVELSIRSALRGGAPIDPFIAHSLIAELGTLPAASVCPAAPGSILSERELQILRNVADGLSNREIGLALHISRHTVESHVKQIYRKLAVSSRIRAVSEARALGLLG
jgi:DNA-binding NarL/FixJ family response regulator